MIKIAIDTSPLFDNSSFRGVGMYTKRLIESLRKEEEIELLEFKDGHVPDKKVDLVHYPYFFPFAFSLPLFPPQRYLVTVHDLIPLVFSQAYPPGLKGKVNYLIQRELLKKASAIIADSQSSADDIVRFIAYPREKIKVVYLAAANQVKEIKDKEKLKMVRQKYNLPERFVLYVGDVNYNKNLPRLVRASRLANIPLVIAGKQAVQKDFDRKHPENKPLVELNELTKEENDVLKLGFVQEDNMAGLYTLAQVYCQPSLYEGFGVPLLEAMACGCPVVASKVSSLPEVGGEAAVYVDPYNIEDIAQGIKKLIENNALRAEIIKAGFKQLKKFSWKKTAGETIKVYEKILEKQPENN